MMIFLILPILYMELTVNQIILFVSFIKEIKFLKREKMEVICLLEHLQS